MAHVEYRAAIAALIALACWSGPNGSAALAAENAAPAPQQSGTPAPDHAAAAPEANEAAPVAEGPPVFLAVTGVRTDDVLHLRDVPSADSKSLAGIPPNARGLKKIGCMRVQLSMDRYMYMSKEERNHAQAPWCRVEYKGMQGWVAERYVKEEGAPKR